MFRTNSTFTLLQALTAVVTFAIILWFVGVPSFRAEAANVTSFSNTLSDSAPAVVSNHTLTFVTPTGLAAGETISIDFGTSTVGANATITVEIGTNATTGGTGTNQITNPSVGSYEITVAVGNSDTGTTLVAIVDVVTVTAAVETIL